ncbi:MAG TPA: hypothetical protein VG106_02885 [Vicinamibacterales bacterium]|nr:hypothetical protein [Vicinamibacterales bacterium]
MSRASLRLRLLAALVLTTVVAACSADPGWPPEQTNFELAPVPVNQEIAVGENRLLFNVLDRQNQSIASAETSLSLRFFDLAASRTQPAAEADGAYMDILPGRPGLYRAEVNLTTAGEWGVEATATQAGAATRMGRFVFTVREASTTPPIGQPAPASDTPTASTPDEIRNISTDDDPDPDFYRESVASAIAAREPFAVVFATPAFCRTATCGPALDVVKSAASEFKGRMEFIHVEPYELEIVDGSLQPVLSDQNLPVSVPATNEWGLPTEPYIFVVDAQGNVSAKFEGIAAVDELRVAFEEVAQPA